jgi:hypothetical protein
MRGGLQIAYTAIKNAEAVWEDGGGMWQRSSTGANRRVRSGLLRFRTYVAPSR